MGHPAEVIDDAPDQVSTAVALRIEVAELARVVEAVRGSVIAKTTLPVLSCVLIDTREGRLTIRGTDLETEAEATAAAEIESEGVIAIQGAMIAGVVKGFPKGATAALKVDGERAILSAGRSRYQLRFLEADTFPLRKEVSGVTFNMPAADLHLLAIKTISSVFEGTGRDYLRGAFLHARGGELVAVATEGHRLARVAVPLPEGAGSFHPAIVPTKAWSQILAMTQGVDAAVSVSISKERISVAAEGARITSQLIANDYPDYARVIPPTSSPIVTVRPAAMAEAAERAFVVYGSADATQKTKATIIRCAAAGDELTMRTGTRGGDAAEETVPATVHQEDGCFVCNARYLADLMKLWPETVEVEIQQVGRENPILITAPEYPAMLQVIMPMAMN